MNPEVLLVNMTKFLTGETQCPEEFLCLFSLPVQIYMKSYYGGFLWQRMH